MLTPLPEPPGRRTLIVRQGEGRIHLVLGWYTRPVTLIGRWLSPEDPGSGGKPDASPPSGASPAGPRPPADPAPPKPKAPPLTEALREIADKGPNPSLPVLHQMCESWIRNGLISEKNLRSAILSCAPKAGKWFIGHLLVEENVIIEEEVLYTLSKICRIPCYNISHYEINPAALAIVNRDQAYAHEILPVDILGKILTVAITNPFVKLPFLAEKKLEVKKILCTRDEMIAALDIYYPEEPIRAAAPPPLPAATAAKPSPAPVPPSISIAVPPPPPPPAGGKPSLDAVFEAWSHAGNGTQPVLARRLLPEEVEFHIRSGSA